MMQFTEIPKIPTPSLHQTTTMMNKIRPWPSFPTSKPTNLSSSSSNSHNLGDANCMEQLLVHCAEAIENNDATPAQQILWVLNNIAPPDGDSNQRLTCAFLRALILRASITPSCKFILNTTPTQNQTQTLITTTTSVTPSSSSSSSSAIACGLNQMIHKFSLLDLANFVHLTPWHRFGFTVANSVILEAIEGRTGVHIVDLSVTRCMQIPTLIDAIASRYHGRQPPMVRLTVGAFTQQVPPMFDFVSYDDLGNKLINFARSKGVMLEFKAVPTTPSDGFASVLDEVRTRQQQIRFLYRHHNEELLLEDEEALVVNCQMALHYLNHVEPEGTVMSTRSMFFKGLRTLEPTMVVVVEEDVDFTSRSMVGRLRSAYNYFWIPFDTVDTFLPRGSKQREWYEADICWKIENVICHEGDQRVERQEPRARWAQRMSEAEFRAVEFVGEVVAEVKNMLEEHATGWGSKKEDEDLMLTWKGHNVVFATALVPS